MLKSNYLIINNRPQAFHELRIAGRTAVFLNDDGKPLDFGMQPLDDSVYAMLSCEELRFIVIVTDRYGSHDVIDVFWMTDDGYEEGSRALSDVYGRRVYRQDNKLISYARSIAQKLDAGVRIGVADAVDASEMLTCRECGMLNPKGSQYCLECGAEL